MAMYIVLDCISSFAYLFGADAVHSGEDRGQSTEHASVVP